MQQEIWRVEEIASGTRCRAGTLKARGAIFYFILNGPHS